MMLATTTLEASVTIPCLKKQLKVHITQGQNIKDIVYHLVQTHAIPPYLTNSIYSNLLVLMKQACEQTLAYQHIHQKQDKQTLRQLFLDAYQSNTLQYNNKPEEDIFPRAYHTLVHCPIAAIFDTLLELENNYAMAVQELHMAREDELAMIQTRQAQEIESPSSGTASPRHSMASVNSNMTSIFTRQVEEIEVFQATWQSDMLQTRQTQRQEYREFVIELYREYQARLASLSDEQHLRPEDTLAIAEKKIDGKDMVAAAAGRVKQWDTQSKTASLRSESTGSKKSDQAPSVNEEVIKSIQEMGFERDQAETALVLSNQNLEAAIGLLLENPAKVDAHLNEQKSQRPTSSTLYRRSQSLSQVPRPPLASPQPSKTSSSRHEPRRHSLQRLGASTPTFLNMMGPNHTKSNSSPNLMIPSQPQPSASSLGKSWMNSFLHQQKQAMENTNLSSVRKLGGWLGKAMENLGIDEQRSLLNKQQQQHQHYNVPQLVESFTIMMGSTQIKSSHNLRLLVTDEATEIFHPFYDPPREMAYRAETSTKLYTSHLSAVIVLVELSELMRPQQQGWRQYKTGKGSNKALFERCQQSTEFHFADIETQLSLIEQDFEDHPNSLVEGSFFVTKHANLPSTQVVFHLVVDSAGMTATDITNRHPVILGLRHILKMTCQFDISSLSIPLLLLPDRFMDQTDHYAPDHMLWLQKRGEVVMKCIKGFLIENSRSGKRVQSEGSDRTESSMGGGGMRNVEFLLPNRAEVYKTGLSSPLAMPSTNNSNTNTSNNNVDTNTIPPEVEVAFQQFRTLLVNLFRTS